MGNSVTTSSQTATDSMLGSKKVITPEPYKETHENEPPPECPMHKMDQLTTNYTNECPIDQMNDNDISPLNMVCMTQNLFTN